MSKRLVEQCVGLDPNIRKEYDVGMTWEGNYWNDHDIHDCCDMDWLTCEILVRKIGETLRQHASQREKIILFLPRVLQLPLLILAANRVGVVPIIIDPLTSSPSIIASIIQDLNPKLMVTVDAFWQGQNLIEVKKTIENLDEMADVQILVIRHVAPNFGVPPPRKHLPAKRPSYKTMLDLRDGKDLEWATAISGIEESVIVDIFDWDPNDVMAILVDQKEPDSPRHVRLGELEASLKIVKNRIESNQSFGGVENILVLDFPSNFESFVNFLTPWYCGKTLTLYEGPLDYPDSSRLSQIIGKHNVDVVIATSTIPLQIPNPEYLSFFDTKRLKFIICASDDSDNATILKLFEKPMLKY